MSIAPGELSSVAGITDPETHVEANLNILTRLLYKREPSYVNGVATTSAGPPTTGDHVLNEIWFDANLATFICITAGTPGTWQPIGPSLLEADPCTVLQSQIFN